MNPLMQAKIREQDCIGCTKCIQACPYDAIMGTAKLMHTVLINECTGCGDCVAPCPVDCIDLISRQDVMLQTKLADHSLLASFDVTKAEERRLARATRLTQHQHAKLQQQTSAKNLKNNQQEDITAARKSYILEAIKRSKSRRKPHG